jgi:hypothetical protein
MNIELELQEDGLTQSSNPRDQHFDPFYVIPDAAEFIAKLLGDCEAAVPRKRRRKVKDRESFGMTINAVVANALLGSERVRSKSVHYSRQAEFYSLMNYRPSFMGYVNTIKAVDELDSAGYLTTSKGSNSQSVRAFFKTLQSTFTATDKLVRLALEFGIDPSAVTKTADAPVLILKDSKKKLLRYDEESTLLKQLDCPSSKHLGQLRA